MLRRWLDEGWLTIDLEGIGLPLESFEVDEGKAVLDGDVADAFDLVSEAEAFLETVEHGVLKNDHL